MARRGRLTLSEERFFFVTTTVVNHAKVFTKDKYCDILIRQVKEWQPHFNYSVLGYVIMPTHFHWIVEVEPKRGTISDIMREIKSRSACSLMDVLLKDGQQGLSRLFSASARELPDQRRRFWMKRFDHQVIRNQRMLLTKLNYIHNNPVKAGLVERPEDYKYSSARNYLLGDHSVLCVDTSYAG